MQALEFDRRCPECSKRLVDAGDELVCPGCGITQEKMVSPVRTGLVSRAPLVGRQALGSYMGSLDAPSRERSSRGITGTSASFEYLKVLSDFAGRYDGTEGSCARLIERVGEKLLLPRIVLLEAASIARRVLAGQPPRRRVSVAAVSAYSLISACKVAGAASISVREIVAAHAALGRRVTSSSIIQLTLASPVRTFARTPEDYLTKVLAKLSMNPRLAEESKDAGVQLAEYLNRLRGTAVDVLAMLGEEARAGRRPCALAASAVYSAETVLSICEERHRWVTQRELAECSDTAEYTIREQCARMFLPIVGDLVANRRAASGERGDRAAAGSGLITAAEPTAS
jgi:transcription initiation factor TFIIIB Brf1 subunit/transcription initiation factor TFIIB